MTARFRLFVSTLPCARCVDRRVGPGFRPGRRQPRASGHHWGADLGSSQVLGARSDQPRQREGSQNRVALEIPEIRPASSEQHGGHPADGGRCPLHDCRVPPQRRRDRRRNGRNVVDVSARRRPARRSCAAQRVARGRILDGRQTGADHSGHARVSARVARRQDRVARSGLREKRRRRSVSGLRSAPAGRRRHQLDVAGCRREERHRLWRGHGGWDGAALEGKHQGIHSRLRRALGKTAVDVPHHPAAR